MAINIGFPIPKDPAEVRRSIIPNDVGKVCKNCQLFLETGYGQSLGLTDELYVAQGAKVVYREEVLSCPAICIPKTTSNEDYLIRGKLLFGWMHAAQNHDLRSKLIDYYITAIAWEDMYDDNGKHLFWENNVIAGYQGVKDAFSYWYKAKFYPRIAVLGQGNVAMGACRYLEEQGYSYTVYGRNQETEFRNHFARYDVIINAVKWNLLRKDHLLYKSDLKQLKPGSLIIDISCDPGLGIETCVATSLDNPIYTVDEVVHYAVSNTAALDAYNASKTISSVVSKYLSSLTRWKYNPSLNKAAIIHNGLIRDENIQAFTGEHTPALMEVV